jgi:RNA recognition motif-containing protein
MKDLFRQAGPIIRTDTNRDRNTGTVVFEKEENVKDAIETFNGFEWNGSKLVVRGGGDSEVCGVDVV